MTVIATDNMLLAAPEIVIAAEGEPKRQRINIVAYTGGIMTVPGWGQTAIDLAGLDASGQIPLLADHDARVGGVVGHGAAEIRDGKLIVAGVVSGVGEAAKHIVELSQGGFQFEASVGVEPIEHLRVKAGEKINANGRVLSSPRGFTLVRRGRLREVSITPVGADAETSVAIAARRKVSFMDTDVHEVDENVIRADERERLKQIEGLCRSPAGGWGQSQAKVEELKASAITGSISVADLSAELLNMLRESRPKVQARWSAPDVGNATILEAALLGHMGLRALGEKALGALAMEHGERLKAAHVLDLCRTALQLDGQDVPHGRDELVRASLSTISLPTALGNVASKLLLDSYTESPATWRSFAAIRSASNFHDHTAIRPSFTGSLQHVPQGGEIKHGSTAEMTSTFRVDTFARMLGVDRRDLVNDDLSVFDQTARAFGRAAMRKLSDLVYEVLLANAGGFFSLGNGNDLSGVDTALGVEALSAAIAAMLTQRDDESNDLDLRPATLVVPPELQTVARAVLESEYITTTTGQPTGNSVRQAVALEVEPRLSNSGKYSSASSKKAWYLFAASAACPMIVAFLNGQQSPTTEFFGLDRDIDHLAVSWRVYFDFGAALCDPRAAVRVKGEA
jgi:hypothetical protein